MPTLRFDSSHPHGAHGWAMPLSRPKLVLTCDAATLRCDLRNPLGIQQSWTDPYAALRWMLEHLRSLPDTGLSRWAGYIGYDFGRLTEHLPARAADDVSLPLFAFGLCAPADAEPDRVEPKVEPSPFRRIPASNFSRDEYESAVSRAMEYIREGDVFQINLAQRLRLPATQDAASIYSRLCARSPAWYGALLDFPAGPWGNPFALLSNSPELFLHLTPDGQVTTRPIKGTRPLAPGMDQDLLVSTKDQAELAMIVDLQRNDLGRVCEVGTVRVTEPRLIEAHPTVFHGVATIEGQLRPDQDAIDLLQATFPCGSVTGCPKIRAMQIIDELEPSRRGAYCGAIGYFCQSGAIQFNVAIRTMTLRDGQAYVPVGGGIVADSVPADEFEETLVKARALLSALD